MWAGMKMWNPFVIKYLEDLQSRSCPRKVTIQDQGELSLEMSLGGKGISGIAVLEPSLGNP
jgi:hypothetical protein